MSTVKLPASCMVKIVPQTQRKSVFIKSPASLGSVRSISKGFGLKASSGFRASAVHKVKLVCPDGVEHELEVPSDTVSLMQLRMLESNSLILAGQEVHAQHAPGRFYQDLLINLMDLFWIIIKWRRALCSLVFLTQPQIV